ncbi:hypothetical protein GGX14DRAFT_404701 [Mycena pura]|uniref:Uncharacterized protein n=1 Tax=Mycena pura TaxID=153505 RepID=A0AAD6UU66_9AGAR|nr:hypothetical protein GGX14DRAFT_404701 [Mycena pura]
MGAGGAGVRGHMISALQAVAVSEGFRWVVLEVVTTHRNPSDRGHWAWDSEVIWGNKTKNTIFAPAQTACRVALMGGVELGWINQTPAVKHPQSNARYQPHAINRARAINRLAIDAWTRPVTNSRDHVTWVLLSSSSIGRLPMGAGGAGVRGHMISALQAVAASEGFRWVVLEVVTTHRNPSDRGHWAWDSEVIWGNKTKNTIFAPAQTACRVALMGGVELGWINQTPAVKHPQSNARHQPHAINRARAINRLAIDAKP